MSDIRAKRRRIWGWYFFDWASQPYNTLLVTFIFAPYIKELLGDGPKAQTVWSWTIAFGGVIIALLAPILGVLADLAGNRMRWIWLCSVFYVVGAAGLWLAMPGQPNLVLVLGLFVAGMVAMELATAFTNALLPGLCPHDQMGRVSGNGWAFGYLGGMIALVIMLVFFAESAATGRTFVGLSPAFGLDPEMREGTRFVGPLTALWYIVFMVPFFLWVRDGKPKKAPKGALPAALREVGQTIRRLPKTPSLFAFLGSSMFYRDGLNGMYAFGGIYAAGVLGWTVVDVGIFGITAIVCGAIFAWIGGHADDWFGPKPVITFCIIALTFVAVGIVFVSPTQVYGIPVAAGSPLPDAAMYLMGAVIGAAGGVIQSASRTMMARQGDPERLTESFGLYALAGKSTSFMAPLLIGIATYTSGSQQIGVSPLIALFLVGLILLLWVKPDGDSRS